MTDLSQHFKPAPKPIAGPKKPKGKIAKLSNKQSKVKNGLREIYAEIDAERLPVCQGCGCFDGHIAHSHTISQKRCKQLHKEHLITNKGNIELMCNKCHRVWETGKLILAQKLINCQSMIAFVKIHDTETYNKITSQL